MVQDIDVRRNCPSLCDSLNVRKVFSSCFNSLSKSQCLGSAKRRCIWESLTLTHQTIPQHFFESVFKKHTTNTSTPTSNPCNTVKNAKSTYFSGGLNDSDVLSSMLMDRLVRLIQAEIQQSSVTPVTQAVTINHHLLYLLFCQPHSCISHVCSLCAY